MTDSRLSTVAEVFDALGGIAAVAGLIGVPYNNAAQWKYNNKLPAKTYPVLTQKLLERSITAPGALWGVSEAVEAAE